MKLHYKTFKNCQIYEMLYLDIALLEAIHKKADLFSFITSLRFIGKTVEF